MIKAMMQAMNEEEAGALSTNPGIEEIIEVSSMSLYDFCGAVLRLEDLYANYDPETDEIECDLEDSYTDVEIFMMTYMRENHCKLWDPGRNVWVEEGSE